ncbi:MAG: enoyl-CoA hydratase-related protein [Betaproteobacteria bacterium]|nr:enoyl-CoA hydratase-related protein [Betaproteobacteria bacterium]
MHIGEDQRVLVRTEERGTTGRVVQVTVNNPDRRNVLGIAGKQQLAGAFRKLARDPLVRVVVLTGAGERSFIAGADLAEMKDLNRAGAIKEHSWTHRACAAIRALPVPVIARINGYCFGAGMEIATACDMRVGVTPAKFGMPEVRFGIPSGMEACLLPQLIGWGKTRELVYTGDHIEAAEAYRIGFLEKLVEPVALDVAVDQWVASILAGGPRAIRLQKALVHDWERLSIEKAIQAGIRACVEARRTDEPRRLMQAFLDRKKRRKA